MHRIRGGACWCNLNRQVSVTGGIVCLVKMTIGVVVVFNIGWSQLGFDQSFG